EATNAIFLKQHLTSAAYEAARAAIAPGQTTAGATSAANAVLTQFNVSGSSVSISPSVSAATTTGTQITVTINAPLSSNSCMSSFIMGSLIPNVGATVIMEHQ